MYFVLIDTGNGIILATCTGSVYIGNEVAYKLTEDAPEAMGIVVAEQFVLSADDDYAQFVLKAYGDFRKVGRVTARYDRTDFK